MECRTAIDLAEWGNGKDIGLGNRDSTIISAIELKQVFVFVIYCCITNYPNT